MAEAKATVASGADPAGEAARRRHVPGSTAPAQQLQQPQPDEQKIHGKKVASCTGVTSLVGGLANLVDRLQQPTFLDFLDDWEFIIAPLIFTALAFFTRLYKIGLSPIVTWDVSSGCLAVIVEMYANSKHNRKHSSFQPNLYTLLAHGADLASSPQ